MDAGAEPPFYRAWLVGLFDVHAGDYRVFDFAEAGLPSRMEDAAVVALITHTLTHCGRDLDRFSDDQVADGLRQIFNNAFAGLEHRIRDGGVPFAAKREAILAIRTLYADCFAERCAPLLGHRSETAGDALSGVCYMFWDVSQLAYWEGRPDRDEGYAAVLEVLESVLGSANDACVESALHDLGHLHLYRPEAVPAIVDRMLAKRPGLRPELRAYALAARAGRVQ